MCAGQWSDKVSEVDCGLSPKHGLELSRYAQLYLILSGPLKIFPPVNAIHGHLPASIIQPVPLNPQPIPSSTFHYSFVRLVFH